MRFLFYFILVLILYSLLHFLIKDMPSVKKRMDRKTDPEDLVQDPCCQTYISRRSALKKKIAGNTRYFCSRECLKNYLQSDVKKN